MNLAAASCCCTIMVLLTLPDAVFAGLKILTSRPNHASATSTRPPARRSNTSVYKHVAATSSLLENGQPFTAVTGSRAHEEDLMLDVAECMRDTRMVKKLRKERVQFFYASTGTISSATTTSHGGLPGGCHVSLTVPRGMIVEMTVLELWPGAVCDQVFFELYEIRHYKPRTLCQCSDYLGSGVNNGTETFPVARSITNNVRVQISRLSFDLPFSLRFRLSAGPAPNKAQLQVVYDTPFKGFIQTPQLQSPDSKPADPSSLRPYPAGMSSRVKVEVPRGHSVMFTILHMDVDGVYSGCDLDGVCLYVNTQPLLLGCYCDDVLDGPWLLRTEVLHVHFVSYPPQGNRTGFKLHFSFHRQSALLTSVYPDQWNCSVPHWPDFKQHFPCNLKMDCAEGEDEQDCPYVSPSCPHGHFSAGGSCFRYFDLKTTLTWNEAAMACVAECGPSSYLAALNTPGEWTDVLRLLRLREHVAQVEKVYIGLRYAGEVLPQMYQYNMQWMDSSIAFYVHVDRDTWTSRLPTCGYLPNGKSDSVYNVFSEDGSGNVQARTHRCDKKERAAFLCETDKVKEDGNSVIELPEGSATLMPPVDISHVVCPLGHVTHQFLACDSNTMCWGRSGDVTSCAAPLTLLPPSFECTNTVQHVPYTLVCDYRQDCIDGSDEDFCVHALCPFDWFQCGNGQCVELSKRCDDVSDCQDTRDELQCAAVISRPLRSLTVPPPAVVLLASGPFHPTAFLVQPINTSRLSTTPPRAACPETHFQCPGNGYCLPVFVRCNGVRDCPGDEDETGCESYTCPGFYRCRGSEVCLHSRHVCDGIRHCPQKDDELYCGLVCPRDCTCYGLAYICMRAAALSIREVDLAHVRFLDASGTGLTTEDIVNSTMMIYLSLAGCSLSKLNHMRFANLRSLDLGDNFLTNVNESDFADMLNLRELSLAGNPLASILTDAFSRTFRMVRLLDLSRVAMSSIGSFFSGDNFPALEVLNLSFTGITSISGKGFPSLTRLDALDLRGCPITKFTRDIFLDLRALDKVYADNYKLCCPAILPDGFNLKNCHAPRDEISSCDALLQSIVYRAFLFLFSSMALVGNFGCFVYRAGSQRSSKNKAFNLFVTHLCVADFLMGIYLMIIGVTDQVYRGAYLWKDVDWRHGAACKTAGFLSLLSSEMSAFIICLITLDRFLVLRFPLSRVHFGMTSGQVTMMVTWCVGLALAAVPLLPTTSHWEFYSQTAICIPLPVTRKWFAGHGYSFGVMVVTNFILFLFIALGQLSIYSAVRANSMASSDCSQRSMDLTIASRLIAVAMSDFLCWFPIGLLGILTARGVAISGEVNVAMAIFVLPFNSALNPFLYTLNMILERRQKARDQRLRLFLLSQAKHTETLLR